MNIQAREFGTMHVLDIDTDCTMTDSFFVDADRESVVGKAQSPPNPSGRLRHHNPLHDS